MNRRKERGPIDHKQVRELMEAYHHAKRIGKPLNVAIAIHPVLLQERPADVGRWLEKLLNKMRIWIDRRDFGYFNVWSRENFKGPNREHVHMLVHVPEWAREDFEAALRRWCPGADNTVWCVDVFSDKALEYLMKQMTSQAWYALWRRVLWQTVCEDTAAKVGNVLGKRCGTSKSLGPDARKAWRDRPRKRSIKAPTVVAVEPKSTPIVSDQAMMSKGGTTPHPPLVPPPGTGAH